MSVGIPCCKTFTITIGAGVMDCGGAESDIADLAWSCTVDGTPGSNVVGENLTGGHPKMTLNAAPGPQAIGNLVAAFCNQTTSVVSLNIVWDFKVLAGAAYLSQTGDDTPGDLWEDVSPYGHSDQFQVNVPACSTINFGVWELVGPGAGSASVELTVTII